MEVDIVKIDKVGIRIGNWGVQVCTRSYLMWLHVPSSRHCLEAAELISECLLSSGRS